MLCIRAQYKIMTCILLPAPIPHPPHNPSQHISMRSPPPACLPPELSGSGGRGATSGGRRKGGGWC